MHVCTIAFLPPPVLLPSCCASSSSSCSPSFSFCFFVLLHANCFLTHVRFFLVAVVAIVGFRFFLVVVLLFLRWVIFFEVSGYSFPLNSSLLFPMLMLLNDCIVSFSLVWCCLLLFVWSNAEKWHFLGKNNPYGSSVWPIQIDPYGLFFFYFFPFFFVFDL